MAMTHPTTAIRPAGEADIPAIFSIRTAVTENHMSAAELAAAGITPAMVATSMRAGTAALWLATHRGQACGFAMARAGRGGSLLVTDNRGRILGETASNSAPFATLLVDVPAIHDSTIYLLFGDWFAYLDLGILAFTLVRLMASRVA